MAGEDVFALDVDVGGALAVREDRFADNAAEAGGDADADDTGLTLLGVTGGFTGVTGLDDEFARLFQEGVAGAGEFDFAFVAHQEDNTEVFFELADLAAQRGLGD